MYYDDYELLVIVDINDIVIYFVRFKMEFARTSTITWTKLCTCTKLIYILLQTSVLLFQIYYQKKSFLTTPNIKNKFCSSTEFQ